MTDITSKRGGPFRVLCKPYWITSLRELIFHTNDEQQRQAEDQ